MPNDALVTSTWAGLPADYCFTTFNRLFLDAFAQWAGYLPGTYSTFVVSQNEPDITDRDKVWIQVDGSGLTTGRVFTYLGGWFMRNPRRDPNERVWWVGSESDAWSYDGGDGTNPTTNPPTSTTGAMWVRDTDFNARFPLQAGTSPAIPWTDKNGNTQAAGSTVFGIGSDGGEELHALDNAELPFSGLIIPQQKPDPGAPNGNFLHHDTVQDVDVGVNRDTSTNVGFGNNEPHQNMPPFRVGLWLKPTARQFYTP